MLHWSGEILWWMFKLLPDVASIFLAAVALIAIVKPEWVEKLEGEDKKTLRTWGAVSLIVLGIAAVISNQVQKVQDSGKALADETKLQQSVDGLKGQLHDQEVNSTAENQYLRGRLDELSEFTPAVLKLAQASEENTRREYEQKVLSNRQLRDFISDVVARMRDWEGRRKQADDAFFNKMINDQQQISRSGDPNKIRQQFDQLRSTEMTDEMQMDATFQREFRDKILADAIFARDQLITRLGLKAQPDINVFPGGTGSLLIFQGQFFGADPVGMAASYLEQFARRLSP